MRQKTIIPILFLLALTMTVKGQIQYYNYKALSNPSAMGEQNNFSLGLAGTQSLTGFEGAPVDLKLQATIPLPHKKQRQSYSEVEKKTFLGVQVSNKQIGIHKNTSAMADFGYKLQLSSSYFLAFGVGGGVDYKTVDIDKLENADLNDPVLSDLKGYSRLSAQASSGVMLFSDNLYFSIYSPKMFTDNGYFLQAGWHTFLGGGDDYYINDNNKKSSFEVHLQTGYFPDRKEITQQVSALFTISETIGIGAGWQTPNLNFSGLVSIKLGAIKLCYSYQLSKDNNITNQEVMLVYSFSPKEGFR